MLEFEELSGQVIAAAITVHKELGPRFLESVYEKALATEFDFLRIPCERQKPVQILYRKKLLGELRLDFLINRCLVVELKAIQGLEKIHFAIARSYLKAMNCHVGLLINFATMPLTIKRVGREDFARLPSVPEFLSSKLT
jgi:GxxExxY protein